MLMAAAGLDADGPSGGALVATLAQPGTPQLARAEGEADTFPADVRGIMVRGAGAAAWVAPTREGLRTQAALYVGASSVTSLPLSGRQVWFLNAEPGGRPTLTITARGLASAA